VREQKATDDDAESLWTSASSGLLLDVSNESKDDSEDKENAPPPRAEWNGYGAKSAASPKPFTSLVQKITQHSPPLLVATTTTSAVHLRPSPLSEQSAYELSGLLDDDEEDAEARVDDDDDDEEAPSFTSSELMREALEFDEGPSAGHDSYVMEALHRTPAADHNAPVARTLTFADAIDAPRSRPSRGRPTLESPSESDGMACGTATGSALLRHLCAVCVAARRRSVAATVAAPVPAV
jgi:hypothetical protein